MLFKEDSPQASDSFDESLDEAIAWCLSQRDSGTHVTEQFAVETFPQHADAIRSFMRKERSFELALSQPLNPTSPPPPSEFGKYELRQSIGRGAFGEVYLAWDTEMHRDVALKLARFVIGDAVAQDRFLHEARASAGLAHPNIVRTFDFGNIDDTSYLALEYVDGIELTNWATGPTKPTMAVEMVASIADALVHAHDRGIVHRDLTPKNIIVDGNNNPKILDFGLAKLVMSDTTLLLSGDIVGTPNYVSPEQVTGKSHDVDGRSDIYSVGVILYELLAGKRPLDGPLDLLLHRIQFEKPKCLTKVDPSIPKRLAGICKKCLEKKPENRYANATELRDDLHAFLKTSSQSDNRGAVKPLVATGMLVASLVMGGLLFSQFNVSSNPVDVSSVENPPDLGTLDVPRPEPGQLSRSAMDPDVAVLDATDTRHGLNPISVHDFDVEDVWTNWKTQTDKGRAFEMSECILQRDWTPNHLVWSDDVLGKSYLRLPSQKSGCSLGVSFGADSKYHVISCRGAKSGGVALFGISYCEVVDGLWNEIEVYRQRIAPPSECQRGNGDGMTLHQFGCVVPENATNATIWIWQDEARDTELIVDAFGLFEYSPSEDENLVLAGKFTTWHETEFEIRNNNYGITQLDPKCRAVVDLVDQVEDLSEKVKASIDDYRPRERGNAVLGWAELLFKNLVKFDEDANLLQGTYRQDKQGALEAIRRMQAVAEVIDVSINGNNVDDITRQQWARIMNYLSAF